MKATNKRVRLWRRHVEEFERGHLRRKEYCQANGIAPHRLDYWRRRFRETDPIAVRPANDWIPLKVSDESVPDSRSSLRLQIGRLTIDVHPGFNRDLLVDVLRTVGPVC